MDDQWHLMTARPYRNLHHVVDHADHVQLCGSEKCDTFLPNFTDHVFMPWVTRNFAWRKFAFSQTLKIKLGLIFWHFYFPKFESQNITLANTLLHRFEFSKKLVFVFDHLEAETRREKNTSFQKRKRYFFVFRNSFFASPIRNGLRSTQMGAKKKIKNRFWTNCESKTGKNQKQRFWKFLFSSFFAHFVKNDPLFLIAKNRFQKRRFWKWFIFLGTNWQSKTLFLKLFESGIPGIL